VLLDKFKGGETRVEIEESVRGKDVFIIQSGGGKGTLVPIHLMRSIFCFASDVVEHPAPRNFHAGNGSHIFLKDQADFGCRV
jgi:hypothetical protein